MSDYITTSKAAELMGVTARTVRRKIANLSPELSDYVRKDKSKILIDKRLIDILLKEDNATNKEEQRTEVADSSGHLAVTVETLREQLDRKDEQINSLMERIHEQNVIIVKMQEEKTKLLSSSDSGRTADKERPQQKETPKPISLREKIYFIYGGIVIFLVIVLMYLSFAN